MRPQCARDLAGVARPSGETTRAVRYTGDATRLFSGSRPIFYLRGVWIHLLRHGIAIDRDDPACPTDPERFLTDKGKTKTSAAARGAKEIGITADLLLCSPYLRAQQTADIAVTELRLGKVRRVDTDALLPMAEPQELLEVLRGHSAEHVLCVGHAPNLDRLVAHLVGSDDPFTRLKKASFAAVSMTTVARGGGHLYGLYSPAVLRKLGGER